jgi:hypothetical protein
MTAASQGFSLLIATLAFLSAANAKAPTAAPPAQQVQTPCTGHLLLPTPRPEASCQTTQVQVYPSPDGAIHALVLPSDVDLHATPDLESRVVLRTVAGNLLTSRDYSSPRGSNGYYVVTARWSPDSQFFAFSLSSSGGHSPWSFPIWVYSRQTNAIFSFSQMIGDKPTLSGDFGFAGTHTMTATTWEKPGSTDKGVPVTVDLAEAIEKIPASAE